MSPEDPEKAEPAEPGFWSGLQGEAREAVDAFLEERFGELHRLLSRCLEDVDPMDVVYPDSPGEYRGVVRELLVLLWPWEDRPEDSSRERLDPLVERAFSVHFPDRDEWGAGAVAETAGLIAGSVHALRRSRSLRDPH